MRNNRFFKFAISVLLPLLFWGGALWAIALLINKPFLLPTPPAILSALWAICTTAGFWVAIALSLLRVLGGLAIGVFAGVVIGVLIHLFPATAILLRPLLTVVRSTPVASFVILVWSFTGSTALPFVIAALMVAPIVADELSTGLSATDKALNEMTSLFGFSPYRRFVTYRLPAALPYLFGAVTTSVGFAWKAGVAAEILAATARSVGREIYFSKIYAAIDELWAWTLAVVVLSLILEFFVKKTLRFVRRRSL